MWPFRTKLILRTANVECNETEIILGITRNYNTYFMLNDNKCDSEYLEETSRTKLYQVMKPVNKPLAS